MEIKVERADYEQLIGQQAQRLALLQLQVQVLQRRLLEEAEDSEPEPEYEVAVNDTNQI